MVSYEPIGVVRSPFHERAGMPLQSVAAAEVHGQVEIEPAHAPVVRLHSVQGATLQVSGLDLLDGTPVLDIKPYVPAFDVFEAERTGWLEKGARRVHEVTADQ